MRQPVSQSEDSPFLFVVDQSGNFVELLASRWYCTHVWGKGELLRNRVDWIIPRVSTASGRRCKSRVVLFFALNAGRSSSRPPTQCEPPASQSERSFLQVLTNQSSSGNYPCENVTPVWREGGGYLKLELVVVSVPKTLGFDVYNRHICPNFLELNIFFTSERVSQSHARIRQIK